MTSEMVDEKNTSAFGTHNRELTIFAVQGHDASYYMCYCCIVAVTYFLFLILRHTAVLVLVC